VGARRILPSPDRHRPPRREERGGRSVDRFPGDAVKGGAGTLDCGAETRLRTPEVVEFAMSSVHIDGKRYGHGWTRIHTHKKRLGFICVNPCPSVAQLVL